MKTIAWTHLDAEPRVTLVAAELKTCQSCERRLYVVYPVLFEGWQRLTIETDGHCDYCMAS